MKRLTMLCLIVIMVLAICTAASAKLPKDFQDFKARFEKEARTEQGAVKLFFEAIYCYLNEDTRAEASKMLRYALYDAQPIERLHTRATFVSRMKNESYHYIFRSYAVGTAPENNYSMSPDDFELEFTRRQAEPDGNAIFYIKSSGADTPRPIGVRKYDDLWHIRNFSSIYTEVRAPKAAVDARRLAIDADNDTPGQWDKPVETNNENNNDDDYSIIDPRQDDDYIW